MLNTYNLVNDLESLSNVISGGPSLIAGTAHVAAECSRRGLPVLRADDLLSDVKAAAILGKVAALLTAIEPQIHEWCCSEQEAAAVTARIAAYLFNRLAIMELSSAVGGSVVTESVSATRSRVFPSMVKLLSSGHSPESFWMVRRKKRAYDIDFRSFSGRKIRSENQVRQVIEFKSFDYAAALRCWHNFRNGLKRHSPETKARFRFAPALYPDRSIPPDFGMLPMPFDDQLAEFATDVVGRHRYYRKQLTFLFDRIGPPTTAYFNVVHSEILSGFVEALSNTDAETRMASHGALIEHGSQSRLYVSGLLSRTFFNSFPGIRSIEPRSPFQAKSAWPGQAVVRTIRVQPYSAKSIDCSSQPIQILYAPNFRNWFANYHGMTSTCFETEKCIEALAELVSDDTRFELSIRIKTTPADKPEQFGSVDHSRGLLPEDLVGVAKLGGRVRDVSWEPHSEVMKKADIIITEGLTAVMFEALELRKPIVLLRRSTVMEPSLPAWTAERLQAEDGRNAVYFLTLDDDVGESLAQIAARHRHSPLTDDEIREYVWTAS